MTDSSKGPKHRVGSDGVPYVEDPTDKRRSLPDDVQPGYPNYSHPAQGSQPNYPQPQHQPQPNYQNPQHGSQPSHQNPQQASWHTPQQGQPAYEHPKQGSQPNYQNPQQGSVPNYQGSAHASQASYRVTPQPSHPSYGSSQGPSKSQLIYQKYQPQGDTGTPRRPAPTSGHRHASPVLGSGQQPSSRPVYPPPARSSVSVDSAPDPRFPSLEARREEPSSGQQPPGIQRPAPTRSRELYQTGDLAGNYSAQHGAVRVTMPKEGEVVADRYEIVAEIGTGGFGKVYKAHQRGIEKTVALKVLLPHAAAVAESAARFRREAMLAKELKHHNTITLYDYGQTKDGLTYIAMELLDGHTLEDELVRMGAMEPARVRHIISQVLKSLAEAHAHGIVHRDLKPSNIMLVEVYGEKDFVKVLDFGIARAFEDHPDTFKTQTGTVIGTPQYMAPEQLKGDEVGPQADLYSLGLILTEMVGGHPVFNEENTNLVIVAQLSSDAVPIDDAVLDGPIGSVIYRATAKASSERFSSAGEMLEALALDAPAPSKKDRRAMTSQPAVVLHSVTTQKRQAARPPRSKRKLVMGLVLVLLIAAVTVVGYLVANRLSAPSSTSDTDSSEGGQNVATVTGADDETGLTDVQIAEARRLATLLGNTVWRSSSSVTLAAAGSQDTAVGRVRLVLVSNPLEAEVYRGEELLGETPFNEVIDPGNASEVLTIRRRGYLEQTITVDLTHDAVPSTVVLQREPRVAEEREEPAQTTERDDGAESESESEPEPERDREPEPEPDRDDDDDDDDDDGDDSSQSHEPAIIPIF